jgi:hypothetical protein
MIQRDYLEFETTRDIVPNLIHFDRLVDLEHEQPASKEANSACGNVSNNRFGSYEGNLPVRIKNSKLRRALYPKYRTPDVQLPKLTSLAQYSNALAKT